MRGRWANQVDMTAASVLLQAEHESSYMFTELAVHPEWTSALCFFPGTQRIVHGQNGATGTYWLSENVLTIDWGRRSPEAFHKLGDRFVHTSFLDRSRWALGDDRQASELRRLQKFDIVRCSPRGRPYLLSIRTGGEQNFRSWFNAAGQRNWDMHLSLYDNPGNLLSIPAEIVSCGGISKFFAAHECHGMADNLFDMYEAVAFFDDDVDIKFDDVNLLFEIFKAHDLWLAQPALSHHSFVSWPETLVCPAFKLRFTSFVEVMAPVFAQAALRTVLPTFKMSVSSWGLDYLWPCLLGTPHHKVAIIDRVVATHTKEVDVGRGDFYKMLQSIGVDANDEFHHIVKIFDLDRSIRHFGAVMPDGRVLRS